MHQTRGMDIALTPKGGPSTFACKNQEGLKGGLVYFCFQITFSNEMDYTDCVNMGTHYVTFSFTLIV